MVIMAVVAAKRVIMSLWPSLPLNGSLLAIVAAKWVIMAIMAISKEAKRVIMALWHYGRYGVNVLAKRAIMAVMAAVPG